MTTVPTTELAGRDLTRLRHDGRQLAAEAAADRGGECERYERWVKPVIDRVGAVLLLLLALPVIATVALLVFVRLGRPILFRQSRIGHLGEPIEMLKFRTMHNSRRQRQRPFAGPDRRQRHKAEDDPRHTPLGRFLRRFSLDELPQLWNVVRGDLSLVGPRPELAGVVSRYDDWQHRRHAVKPGITGLWQVTERDERGEMHLHVQTDLRYIRALSWRADLAILLLTIPAVLGRRPERTFGLHALALEADEALPVDVVPDQLSA